VKCEPSLLCWDQYSVLLIGFQQVSNMAASGPAHPESNIFLQFDVQQRGESVAGSAPVAGQFRCLLSPCHEEAFKFKCRYALESHRTRFHGLPSRGKMTLPTLSDIRKWMFLGKPRPYEVPVVKKTSWRDAFLHCSQPGNLVFGAWLLLFSFLSLLILHISLQEN